MSGAIPDGELAVLGVLAAARVILPPAEVAARVLAAGFTESVAADALRRLVADGRVERRGGGVALAPAGAAALLDAAAAIAAALDPSPPSPDREECPSLPWLTTVRTEWIDALSINYAVEPGALARLLPAPLEPEVFKGTAWLQVLLSSLRDMRPQGLASLFGTCFYQVSYRAAVRYRSGGGAWRRGGYFLRSETNDAVMRAIGNRLTEFRFHDFGAAEMVMIRDGAFLTIGVEPEPTRPGGRLVSRIRTDPAAEMPPSGSVWTSLDELFDPLVECYDALGVDRSQGFLYVLTIDRQPWNAKFASPESLYCEFVDSGPLAGGVARLDSVLSVARCAYRWRPLRREALHC